MTTAASGIDRLLADARARLDRLTVTAALDEQRSGALLVDIRPHAQRQADGEVPSALVLERNVLEWRLDPHSDARVPEAAADLRVLVLCAEGYTSSLAAAALRDVGVGRATDVDGGFAAWTAADLPTVPGGTPAGLRSGASPATAPPTTTSTTPREELPVSTTDELVQHAEQYASAFDKGDLPLPPARRVAVVACMDARLDPAKVLGLDEGDAHVIRNAGGAVTQDALRSLAISQRLLGTREIVLLHHTDCGMLTFSDDQLRRDIEAETGLRPLWAAETFSDLDTDVRQSIARIQADPAVPVKDAVRGFVYDVRTGTLREVA